jgi:cephalosporin hydroxylase
MSLRSEEVDKVCASWDKDVMFRSTWLGVQAVKNPCDAWVYQEMIFSLKPDLIIETGSYMGGGALFLASILDLVGKGQVISMDVRDHPKPDHPRIEWLTCNSVQSAVVNDIHIKAKKKNVLLILDSDHDDTHVIKELNAYQDLVQAGGYIIVEDTWWKPGSGGPWDAVQEFLKEHPEFEIDKSKEPYGFTNNPNGFLRRTR